MRRPPISTLFPYTDALPIYRIDSVQLVQRPGQPGQRPRTRRRGQGARTPVRDRKSTRLNSSHTVISYAVFCLKKKTRQKQTRTLAAYEQLTIAPPARRPVIG